MYHALCNIASSIFCHEVHDSTTFPHIALDEAQVFSRNRNVQGNVTILIIKNTKTMEVLGMGNTHIVCKSHIHGIAWKNCDFLQHLTIRTLQDSLDPDTDRVCFMRHSRNRGRYTYTLGLPIFFFASTTHTSKNTRLGEKTTVLKLQTSQRTQSLYVV